ncbi:MAG TPA: hypothetical protein PK821_03925 [Victivallales bacterium]|nr:hypothetical protein [Victivallales bacterium]
MQKKIFWALIFGMTIFRSPAMFALDKDNNPTPYALPSQMQTHLKIDVKEDTKELHLIQEDNDPDVITKVYVLKHADPYELRPYFRSATQSERVNDSGAKVECIKYNDGTGALIVSAEDYRFGEQEVGMGFDEIVELLDVPKITSSSGSCSLVYFPKYHDAKWLGDKLKQVGMNNANDPIELDGGKDKIVVDGGLNGLFFYVPPYTVKNISEMLRTFDTPIPEVKVKYTVYELNNENDGTIGVDFQAWKNGPGSDLFSAASKFTNGWDASRGIVANDLVNDTRSQFFKFSPRWNTKFLDFLAAKGKANVITSGEMSIMNNKEGRIEATTKIAGFRDGAKFANIETFGYYQLTDSRIYNAYTGNWDDAQDDGRMAGRYRLKATDERGNLVSISVPDVDDAVDPVTAGTAVYRGDMTITRVFDGTRYYYGLILDEGSASQQGVEFVRQKRDNLDGVQTGNVQQFERIGFRVDGLVDVTLEVSAVAAADLMTVAGNFYTYRYVWNKVALSFNTDQSDTIYRDVARNTSVDGYGFLLSVIPTVCDETTVVDMAMSNTSLVGFTDVGAPRTSKSEIQNKFMISNKGGRLVVGGVDKQAVVRSVAKLPYLGDIPGLGWVFSSESEITKKSQVVAVLDCETIMPDASVPEDVKTAISEVRTKLDGAGESNSYGFDQIGLDSDKKRLDPLP